MWCTTLQSVSKFLNATRRSVVGCLMRGRERSPPPSLPGFRDEADSEVSKRMFPTLGGWRRRAYVRCCERSLLHRTLPSRSPRHNIFG